MAREARSSLITGCFRQEAVCKPPTLGIWGVQVIAFSPYDCKVSSLRIFPNAESCLRLIRARCVEPTRRGSRRCAT